MDDTTALIPRSAFPDLAENWESYTSQIREQMKKIRKSTRVTPEKYRWTRPGPKGELTYVREEYMRMKLDLYFPDWSWLIVKSEIVHGPTVAKPMAVVHGRLILTMPGVDGRAGPQRVFDAVGSKVMEFSYSTTKNTQGEEVRVVIPVPGCVEAAATNAFKKAVYLATQVAHDVYRPKDEARDLTEKDLETIKKWEPMLEKAVEKATGTPKMKLKAILDQVKLALTDPESANREAVMDALTIAPQIIQEVANGNRQGQD